MIFKNIKLICRTAVARLVFQVKNFTLKSLMALKNLYQLMAQGTSISLEIFLECVECRGAHSSFRKKSTSTEGFVMVW